MRFIVHEQRYERQYGAGQFRYELDNRPTGAVESWRLTGAPDGHTVLRVDLDARRAPSGHSYLYHLVRDRNERPQRLAYRFWGGGLSIAGTLLFDVTSITGTRTVNGMVHEEDLDLAAGYRFWFPSATGLGLLLPPQRAADHHAATLNGAAGGADTLALQQVVVAVRAPAAEGTEVNVAGREITAVRAAIRWCGQERFVTTDRNGWPLQMDRPGYAVGQTLTARETQYIWY